MPRRAIVVAVQFALIAALLLAWQNCSPKQAIYLSRPSEVVTALWSWLTVATYHRYVLVTLGEAALGLLLGCVLAIVIASAMAFRPVFGAVIAPYVTLANATPRVALAPLFLLVFGIGLWSKVLFVATAVMFFPLYAIYRALISIEPDTVANVRILGASRAWLVRDVYLPTGVGAALSSLRVAVTFSLLTAVLAEFMSSQAGIGYAIMEAQNGLNADFAIAGIVVLAGIAFLLDLAMLGLQKRLLAWRGREAE